MNSVRSTLRIPVRLAVAIPMVLLASYAILETLRFASAERLSRRDTFEALQAAVRILPGNADYHGRIATLDPTKEDELRAALKLNPRDPVWWILQSVRQEVDGDALGAEQSLRQANAVSNYYTPRWSFAAFYYRQGNKAEYSRWARLALSVGNGNPESLFRMAQRLALSSEEMLHEVLPADPERLNSYLHFALKESDMKLAYDTAALLAVAGSKTYRSTLLETCEALFVAGRISEAVALWNNVSRAGWMALPSLDPSAGKSLSNGTLTGEPVEKGFDWKYSFPSGISASHAEPDGSLRLEFSGKQPETGDLMSQYLPLLPGRRYKLTVRYRTDGIPAPSGLKWSIVAVPSGQPLFAEILNSPGGESREQDFEFQTPQQSVSLKLLLSYTRLPGTTRIEGKLWIHSVQLALVP